MTNRPISWTVLLGVLAALPCRAGAQAEQWLAYHAGSEGESRVGATPGQTLDLSHQAPPATLPTTFGQKALFAKWTSPLVPQGLLWLVLDRSRSDGAYDRLLIDTNADGSLIDETPIAAASAEAFGGTSTAEFRQVRLRLPGADGPVVYHLDLSVWVSADGQARIVAKAGGWYEGVIQAEGHKFPCMLFDANANGTFDDAQADFRLSDRLKIEDEEGIGIGRVGQFAQVGGKWYALEVARDGAWVKLTPPDAAAIGAVRVGGGVQRLSAGGTKGFFQVPVENGLARLPAGSYRLNHWEIRRRDAGGAVWEAVGLAGDPAVRFEVTAGAPALLDIGEPLICTLWASQSERGVFQFSEPRFAGRSGERVTLSCVGQRAPLPGVRVRNRDGTYDQRFDFSYG